MILYVEQHHIRTGTTHNSTIISISIFVPGRLYSIKQSTEPTLFLKEIRGTEKPLLFKIYNMILMLKVPGINCRYNLQ